MISSILGLSIKCQIKQDFLQMMLVKLKIAVGSIHCKNLGSAQAFIISRFFHLFGVSLPIEKW